MRRSAPAGHEGRQKQRDPLFDGGAEVIPRYRMVLAIRSDEADEERRIDQHAFRHCSRTPLLAHPRRGILDVLPGLRPLPNHLVEGVAVKARSIGREMNQSGISELTRSKVLLNLNPQERLVVEPVLAVGGKLLLSRIHGHGSAIGQLKVEVGGTLAPFGRGASSKSVPFSICAGMVMDSDMADLRAGSYRRGRPRPFTQLALDNDVRLRVALIMAYLRLLRDATRRPGRSGQAPRSSTRPATPESTGEGRTPCSLALPARRRRP